MGTGNRRSGQVWVLNTQYLDPAEGGEEAVVGGLQVLVQGTGERVWQEDNRNIGIFNPPWNATLPFYRVGSYLARPGRSHDSYLVSGRLGTELQFPIYYTFLMSDLSRLPYYLWEAVCPAEFRWAISQCYSLCLQPNRCYLLV